MGRSRLFRNRPMPRNWDEHYANAAQLDFTPSPLVIEVAELASPGRALDLACGAGRHALYLAAVGWQVTAVDASAAAIRIVRERARSLPVDARVADLEAGEFQIGPETYDLICDFHYLQRDLFPAIRAGIRPGGIFAAAIHLLDDSPEARPRNPAWLVRPGELRAEFAGWKILYYSESPEPGHERPTARLLARRA